MLKFTAFGCAATYIKMINLVAPQVNKLCMHATRNNRKMVHRTDPIPIGSC